VFSTVVQPRRPLRRLARRTPVPFHAAPRGTGVSICAASAPSRGRRCCPSASGARAPAKGEPSAYRERTGGWGGRLASALARLARRGTPRMRPKRSPYGAATAGAWRGEGGSLDQLFCYLPFYLKSDTQQTSAEGRGRGNLPCSKVLSSS
jgi:hypothetical protein